MEPVYVAGIDVHKSMLMVVVGAAEISEERYERRKFGTSKTQMDALGQWLQERQVVEVVMESTAQYWRPVWLGLEGKFRLHLAQARSNTGPKGRKSDYRDALRIVRRLLAKDLTLSWVPPGEQRVWRLLARTRVQLLRNQLQARNRIECILEEGRMKLSTVVSDLLGVSGRRILNAVVAGNSDSAALAELAHPKVRASQQQLREACDGNLTPTHRSILKLFLEQIDQLERQIEDINKELTTSQQAYRAAIARLCRVPGIDVHAARQIIAEVGPDVAAFASPGQLASWAGQCPGENVSADVSYGARCPKGNRHLKRILNQVAWAAIRTKGSYFQEWFQHRLGRLGAQKAACAIAHKILCLIWKLLRYGVEYEERGPLTQDAVAVKRAANRHTRALKKLGFDVILKPAVQPA